MVPWNRLSFYNCERSKNFKCFENALKYLIVRGWLRNKRLIEQMIEQLNQTAKSDESHWKQIQIEVKVLKWFWREFWNKVKTKVCSKLREMIKRLWPSSTTKRRIINQNYDSLGKDKHNKKSPKPNTFHSSLFKQLFISMSLSYPKTSSPKQIQQLGIQTCRELANSFLRICKHFMDSKKRPIERRDVHSVF